MRLKPTKLIINHLMVERQGKIMGFRNVIITQHSKLSYSNNAMIVQNKDGANQIPLVDMGIYYLFQLPKQLSLVH